MWPAPFWSIVCPISPCPPAEAGLHDHAQPLVMQVPHHQSPAIRIHRDAEVSFSLKPLRRPRRRHAKVAHQTVLHGQPQFACQLPCSSCCNSGLRQSG